MSEKNSIEILKKLVSFDTTSFKSNLDLIKFIENYLNDLNIKSELIYDETKNIYALKDNNSAILAYGLWKFYLIEEWVKEIEIEKGNGAYTLSCNNFCNLVDKYAVWKPKDNSEWNTDNDLLGIYKKGKDCLSDIIYDLHNRKNSNVDFYKDLELPVE